MDGVLNIYKPSGPSSFAIVESAKKIIDVQKAGHIGTLDPLAEGVLPICFNKATKIIQFLTRLSKVYSATMVLGIETNTQDSTGTVVSERNASLISENMIRHVLQSLQGDLQHG